MTGTTLPGQDALLARVRTALHSKLGQIVDTVADDVALPDALGARYDSLTALECISQVEAEFGIEVDFVEHDVRYWFATIGRIAEFVRDRLEDQLTLGATR